MSFTTDQIDGWLHSLVQITGVAVTVAAGMGLLQGDQGSKLVNGVTAVAGGIATLVGVYQSHRANAAPQTTVTANFTGTLPAVNVPMPSVTQPKTQ